MAKRLGHRAVAEFLAEAEERADVNPMALREAIQNQDETAALRLLQRVELPSLN